MTAIGDAVNTASRVESANKLARTRLLVSGAVIDQVGSQLKIARAHSSLPIPGKSGDFRLSEVTGVL